MSNQKRGQINIAIEKRITDLLLSLGRRMGAVRAGFSPKVKSKGESQICAKQIFNRGQISAEYLIVISFVLFIVLSVLGIALGYSSQIKDSIRFNQIESFSQKVVSQSESVFYAGEPSKTTVRAYLPEGINDISVIGYFIVFNVSTSSGNSVTAYRSNVNLTGDISENSGIRVIYLNATSNAVILSS